MTTGGCPGERCRCDLGLASQTPTQSPAIAAPVSDLRTIRSVTIYQWPLAPHPRFSTPSRASQQQQINLHLFFFRYRDPAALCSGERLAHGAGRAPYSWLVRPLWPRLAGGVHLCPSSHYRVYTHTCIMYITCTHAPMCTPLITDHWSHLYGCGEAIHKKTNQYKSLGKPAHWSLYFLISRTCATHLGPCAKEDKLHWHVFILYIFSVSIFFKHQAWD